MGWLAILGEALAELVKRTGFRTRSQKDAIEKERRERDARLARERRDTPQDPGWPG